MTFFYCVANFAQADSIPKIEKFSSLSLKFDDLKNTSDIFSYRIWNFGQAIDIRILADSTKVGNITNFITELPFTTIDQSREYNEDSLQVYVQKISLTPLEVQNAFQTIERYKIYNLPTQFDIADWKAILDGEFFETEQKYNGIYVKKTYSNPRQQTNHEGKAFVSFFDELIAVTNAKEYYKPFYKNLKIGCYSKKNEGMIFCKTNKRKRKSK
ncbi:MAG: hypothetical protein CFE23_16570 [Flavobacterium sp. BFFFF1]|nr:MAG: hypothetical protein CFE23_16570 [Flavobacterium sp. BFFFF1]